MNKILEYCKEVINDRNYKSVHKSMRSELKELLHEWIYLNRKKKHSNLTDEDNAVGLELGEDGVEGEAIDVALCAIDLAYIKLIQEDGLTHEEAVEKIEEIKINKLEKWKRLYSE